MGRVTRRDFVGGAAALAALSATRPLFATPLGLAPGIQLYSVRDQMAKDFEGTLTAVRKAGYVEVESAALPKKSAAEIRKALDNAGLKCVSSHRGFDDGNVRNGERGLWLARRRRTRARRNLGASAAERGERRDRQEHAEHPPPVA